MTPNLSNTSALSGYVEPAQGRASVKYYPFTPVIFDLHGEPDFTLNTVATAIPSLTGPTITPPSSAQRVEPNGHVRYFYPWQKTGWQPFAWDVVRPVGNQRDPEIRFILGRSVQMHTSRSMQEMLLSRYKTVLYNELTPRLTIIRPQDESLIPQPGEGIDISRVVGRPYIAGPSTLSTWVQEVLSAPPMQKYSSADLYTVQVIPTPMSVIIRNIADFYEIEVGIESKSKATSEPAAFAYEILAPKPLTEEDFYPHGYGYLADKIMPWEGTFVPIKQNKVIIRIIYSGPVYIKTSADSKYPETIKKYANYKPQPWEPRINLPNTNFSPDYKDNLVVQAIKLYKWEDVPIQGSSLGDFFDYYGSTPPYKTISINVKPPPPKRKPFGLTLLETAIGFIPIIGQLYAISEFAYSAITGEDFWGYETGRTDLMILGVGALLPLGLKSGEAVTILRNSLKNLKAGRSATNVVDPRIWTVF